MDCCTVGHVCSCPPRLNYNARATIRTSDRVCVVHACQKRHLIEAGLVECFFLLIAISLVDGKARAKLTGTSSGRRRYT